MRFRLSSSLLFALALTIAAQTTTVRAPMKKVSGIEVVQVSMNGRGPYAFVLDTGANVTLVKRKLLEDLKIPTAGPVTIAASLGDSQHQRADLERITLAGLDVEHMEINTVENRELGTIENGVQGVLGENFLKHFDVLIDNDRQVLILDQTSGLVRTLSGEHLQLSNSGYFNATPTADRIVVPLKMPAVNDRQMLFLVDSGTNTAMLYPAKSDSSLVRLGAAHGSIHSLNKDQRCGLSHTALAIGNQTYGEIMVAACEGMTRDRTDTDGLLPTSIFHRLFVSHSQGYVIANPKGAVNGQR